MTEVAKSELDALADSINTNHRRALLSARESVIYAARCGSELLRAKEALQHGEWLPWLAAHCDVERNQAAKYMRLAREMPELLDPIWVPGDTFAGHQARHRFAFSRRRGEGRSAIPAGVGRDRLGAGDRTTEAPALGARSRTPRHPGRQASHHPKFLSWP